MISRNVRRVWNACCVIAYGAGGQGRSGRRPDVQLTEGAMMEDGEWTLMDIAGEVILQYITKSMFYQLNIWPKKESIVKQVYFSLFYESRALTFLASNFCNVNIFGVNV